MPSSRTRISWVLPLTRTVPSWWTGGSRWHGERSLLNFIYIQCAGSRTSPGIPLEDDSHLLRSAPTPSRRKLRLCSRAFCSVGDIAADSIDEDRWRSRTEVVLA